MKSDDGNVRRGASQGERLMTGEAWAAFCDRLKAAGESILGPGFPDAPLDRAEGHRWLTRLLTHSLRMEVEAGNPLHPCFIRYETPHEQWGGPNPDNLYLRANVAPHEGYRIWANVSGVRQAIFSLNEGDMQLGEFGVYSERSLDQLEVNEDGALEIWLSPEEPAASKAKKNWMPMDPKGRLFTIRVFQSDWENDATPVFHIERIGGEGISPNPRTPADLEASLDRAAHWIERTATFWNAYTTRGWDSSTPNVPARAGSPPGGADNILYGSCFWELDDTQALVIECESPDADYWGFTLHTLGWLESAEFADRQTSLNHFQIHTDDDGRIRIVLAHRDPGTPNWLDIGGRPRGLLVYRWVWARTNPKPSARVVALSEVSSALPDAHPRLDTEQRRRALSRRREAAWKRFQ